MHHWHGDYILLESDDYAKEKAMEDVKPWYASQGVWASMLTILTGVLVSMGMLTNDVAVAIVGEVPGYAVGIMTALAGLWSLWSRVRATKEIAK